MAHSYSVILFAIVLISSAINVHKVLRYNLYKRNQTIYPRDGCDYISKIVVRGDCQRLKKIILRKCSNAPPMIIFESLCVSRSFKCGSVIGGNTECVPWTNTTKVIATSTTSVTSNTTAMAEETTKDYVTNTRATKGITSRTVTDPDTTTTTTNVFTTTSFDTVVTDSGTTTTTHAFTTITNTVTIDPDTTTPTPTNNAVITFDATTSIAFLIWGILVSFILVCVGVAFGVIYVRYKKNRNASFTSSGIPLIEFSPTQSHISTPQPPTASSDSFIIDTPPSTSTLVSPESTIQNLSSSASLVASRTRSRTPPAVTSSPIASRTRSQTRKKLSFP